ncbi:MAG: hypothetical protein ACR2PA_13725 [Hyphomicrobiaceae bacterium]
MADAHVGQYGGQNRAIMPIRILTLLALVGLMVIGAFGSGFWSDRSQQIKHADSASCAVYRSFYSREQSKAGLFIRTATRPYSPSHLISAYMRFERGTNADKRVETAPNRKPAREQLKERFEHDTIGFIEPLFSSGAVSVERCFDKGEHQPKFYDGSFKWLSIREALLGILDRDNRGSVAILSISPVGFSADGRHALLYADYYCEGFCGAGGFFLFEKRVGSWTVIGDNWVWVS